MTRPELEQLRSQVQALVDIEGLRPLAKRSKVPLGSIRSLLDGRNVTFASVKLLADLVGWELRLGPPDSVVRPVENHEPVIHTISRPRAGKWTIVKDLGDKAFFYIDHDMPLHGEVMYPKGTYVLAEFDRGFIFGDRLAVQRLDGGIDLGEARSQDLDPVRFELSCRSEQQLWDRDQLLRIGPITWTGRTPPPSVMKITDQPRFADEPAVRVKYSPEIHDRLTVLEEGLRDIKSLMTGEVET